MSDVQTSKDAIIENYCLKDLTFSTDRFKKTMVAQG